MANFESYLEKFWLGNDDFINVWCVCVFGARHGITNNCKTQYENNKNFTCVARKYFQKLFFLQIMR